MFLITFDVTNGEKEYKFEFINFNPFKLSKIHLLRLLFLPIALCFATFFGTFSFIPSLSELKTKKMITDEFYAFLGKGYYPKTEKDKEIILKVFGDISILLLEKD